MLNEPISANEGRNLGRPYPILVQYCCILTSVETQCNSSANTFSSPLQDQLSCTGAFLRTQTKSQGNYSSSSPFVAVMTPFHFQIWNFLFIMHS
jgi:hypothetical protein